MNGVGSLEAVDRLIPAVHVNFFILFSLVGCSRHLFVFLLFPSISFSFLPLWCLMLSMEKLWFHIQKANWTLILFFFNIFFLLIVPQTLFSTCWLGWLQRTNLKRGSREREGEDRRICISKINEMQILCWLFNIGENQSHKLGVVLWFPALSPPTVDGVMRFGRKDSELR